jgi:hypothetical protein
MPHHHLSFLRREGGGVGGGFSECSRVTDLSEFALVERSAADGWDFFLPLPFHCTVDILM